MPRLLSNYAFEGYAGRLLFVRIPPSVQRFNLYSDGWFAFGKVGFRL